MTSILLVIMLACAMLVHPGFVFLAALYLYFAHKVGEAFKRKRRVYPSARLEPSAFVAPPARLERFRIISGGGK